jgi:hypothetical protein
MEFNGEPESTVSNVKVVTNGQTYKCNSVDLHENYIEVWTSSEQPHTESHLIIPNVRVKEIQDWVTY